MRASAHLAIDCAGGAAGGRSFARDVRAEPPFAIRRAGARFVVVGSAAAPVRGDELTLTLDVAPGAVAEVGTVAATIVWPGPAGSAEAPPSRLTTSITVGAGAHLDWRPEPTVSVAGSDHVARTHIALAGSATCRVVEEFSLGRCGEPSGRLATELRMTRAGRPLVHHGEVFGPDIAGAGSFARLGSARHVLMAVVVGPPAGPSRVTLAPDRASGAWLPVAADAVVVLACGPDRPAVSTLVAGPGMV